MENQNNNNLVNPKDPNKPVVRADINILFSGDSYGLFVFQKTEKLVKATYLLTSLMSDKEPMRERVRELANIMLQASIEMSERIWGEDLCHKNLLSAISEMIVLFDISENTKMMSKMNHQIITAELQKLADFLMNSLTNYSSAKIAFEPGLFDGNYDYVPDQTYQAATLVRDRSITNAGNSIKDKDIYKGQNEVVNHDTEKEFDQRKSLTKSSVLPRTVKDKDNRQNIILSMLQSGVKLTIKDFAKNIRDCSEKTIQRELLSLVSKGVLKKEGERRWSKYFLVK